MKSQPRSRQPHEDESRGIWLANDTILRIGASELHLNQHVDPPEGPHFLYEDGPSLFLGRTGRGPLQVAWDTNLLIDYFEHGMQLWEGEALPQKVLADHGEELEGLQLVMSLWVLRDIRFHILLGVIDDSKNQLDPLRRRQRVHAWKEFCAALALVEDDGYGLPTPCADLGDLEIKDALSHVPAGNDRTLVEDALRSGMHVFMTCDKGVLRAREHLTPLGLLIVSPLDLLEELGASGALHCLFERQHLYWPMPDQQRVSHLIQALGTAAGETTSPTL